MAMACMAAASGHEAAADSVDTLSRELRQVGVTGRRVASQLASDRGVSVVGMGLMRSMPRILGNADPLHYAQMLPGIQTGGEYDAGLHIQGSDNSHNMLAIDGVPIYNAAHLLGFFSVFNATHFSSMRIGKSATAAAAPNRLGGMVDMQAGRDRPPGPTGDVAVGPMSSQATVSLPAGRCSWLTLSARAAYFKLLYSRWLEVDGEELGYFFHDYNLTYTYAPDSRNRLWAEVYYGGDDASYGDGGYGMDTSLGWANFMAALHWDHSSGATGIGQCVYYTRYGSRLGLSQPSVGLSLESRIATAGYKAEARFGRRQGPLCSRPYCLAVMARVARGKGFAERRRKASVPAAHGLFRRGAANRVLVCLGLRAKSAVWHRRLARRRGLPGAEGIAHRGRGILQAAMPPG